MANTITFLGAERTIAPIGGRRLVRFGAALMEFSELATIDVNGEQVPLGKALRGLQPQEYPALILEALQTVLSQVQPLGSELTRAEQLVYGVLGELVGLTADEVADAPLDDLTSLVTTVYKREAGTQTGKWLMATVQKSGEGTTKKPPSDDTSGSPSDTTTQIKGGQTVAISGAA